MFPETNGVQIGKRDGSGGQMQIRMHFMYFHVKPCSEFEDLINVNHVLKLIVIFSISCMHILVGLMLDLGIHQWRRLSLSVLSVTTYILLGSSCP